MTKITKRHTPEITEDMLSSALVTKVNTISSGNSNINICTSLAEITAAGAGAIIEIREPITLTANYQIPANQEWIFTTGYVDVDTFQLDYNGAFLKFSGTKKGIDLFKGTSVGVVYLHDSELYASNFGALDDNLDTTDNFNVGKQLLYAVNQNSGHLVWNKKNTGIYWASSSYPYQFGSPFFPLVPNADDIWLVGNGYDNGVVEHRGTEIVNITDNKIGSRRYIFYNTRNSEIKGGTLRGDRYRHFYDQSLYLTTAATSAGNVRIVLKEVDERISFNTLKTIDKTIALTLSDAATNAQEITDFINTDPAFVDYTATNRGLVTTNIHDTTVTSRYEISIRGAGGSDYELDFYDVDSGAGVVENWSSYEWGHAITYGSNSINCKITDIHLTEFHGDGIDTQTQGNGNQGILFADLTNGFIDENGTIDNGNLDYYYLTTLKTLPTDMDWFSFAPNSQASMNLKNNKYWMVYYDGAGNFLEKSPTLLPYERYNPRKEAVSFRFVVENSGANITSFNYFINSKSDAIGAIIENVEISFVRRDGISNPPHDFVIKDSKIHDCGGQEPQIGINLEDNTKNQRYGKIIRVEFWNNANGDIILKGATQTEIAGCFFRQNSFNVRGFFDSKGMAISTAFGRYTNIHDNFFEHKYVTLDIGTQFHDNDMVYSSIQAQYGGVVVKNNRLENTTVNGGAKGGITESFSAGGSSENYLLNNIIIFNDGWGNQRVFDDYNTFIADGNIIKFNDLASRHFTLEDPTLTDVLVGSTNNYIRSDRTIPIGLQYVGSITNEKISGLKAEVSFKHGAYFTKYVSDIKGLYIDFPLELQAGVAKSVKIEDIKAYKLSLRLDQFSTDGLGDFETITIKDAIIKLPQRTSANLGWLNNSFYGTPSRSNFVKISQDKNVNIIFKNCEFISEDNTTGLFMYLGNRGTTTFIDCTFDSPNSENIDFTSTGADDTIGVYAGANHGVITITNPKTPGNRITFTGATIN